MKIFKKIMKKTSDSKSNNIEIAESYSKSDNIEIPKNSIYKKTVLHYISGNLKHTSYYYYDDHDNEILVQTYGDPIRYYYTYNDYGRVSILSFIQCHSEYRYYYEYNPDKTTSKENCYINGKLYYICAYSYNENNQPAKKEFTFYSNNRNFYVEFEYNSNLKLSVKRFIDKDGISDIERFTYDNKGNLIRKDVDHKIERISFYEIYTYDLDNQLIKTERYYKNKLDWTDEYRYEFF